MKGKKSFNYQKSNQRSQIYQTKIIDWLRPVYWQR